MDEHRFGAGPATVPVVAGVVVVDTFLRPDENIDETVIAYGPGLDDCFSLDKDTIDDFIAELMRRRSMMEIRRNASCGVTHGPAGNK
jgi:hypothetical protein